MTRNITKYGAHHEKIEKQLEGCLGALIQRLVMLLLGPNIVTSKTGKVALVARGGGEGPSRA